MKLLSQKQSYISILLPSGQDTDFSFLSVSVLFFVLLGASLGTLLCFQGIFLSDSSLKGYWFWLLLSCAFSVFLYVFKNKKYHYFLYLAAYSLLLFVFFLLYHKELSSSFTSCIDYLFSESERIYLQAKSASAGMQGGNTRYFLLVLLFLFQYLFLITAVSKRKWIFTVLLCMPVLSGIFLNRNPSFLTLGLFLSSFILWEYAFSRRSLHFRHFPPYFAALAVYILCIYLLVPLVSPKLFASSYKLSTAINALGNTILSYMEASSEKLPSPKSNPRVTYETAAQKQKLENTPPIYNGETMFSLLSDTEITSPMYLRGFVGDSYSEGTWKAASDIASFSQHSLYDLPYVLGSQSDRDLKSMALELTCHFHSAYYYFPYGAQLPDSLNLTESNQISGYAPDVCSFSCIPLSLDTSSFLFESELSENIEEIERSYQTHVRKKSTAWDKDELDRLYQAVSSLPSYPLPASPSYEEICKAISEIQEYLWSQASYSLSLENDTREENFVYDFLYQRQKGFCIHFATAGTLMCRMMGIPARYITGYVIRPENQTESRYTTYLYSIPDSNAHAWTEIYVGRGGWVPVEMTPAASVSNTPESVNPPQTAPKLPEPPKSREVDHISSSKNNAPAAPSNAFSSSAKRFLLIFASTISGALLLCLFLLFVHTVRFKRHMGYFSQKGTQRYLTVFKSLMKLWCLKYHISSKRISDTELLQTLLKRLPNEQRESFSFFYSFAEEISFGPPRSSKENLRELRRLYRLERKTFLGSCSVWKKIYYLLFVGI